MEYTQTPSYKQCAVRLDLPRGEASVQPRGTQMAAFVVSAAAFTVPEAGYVVSAIVFLLQVRARLAARPGRADACRRGAANARGLARGSASASRAHSGLRCAVSGPILQLRPRRGARTIRGRLYLHEIASVPRGPAARGERGCTARARGRPAALAATMRRMPGRS